MIILQYTLSIWTNKPRDDEKENKICLVQIDAKQQKKVLFLMPIT